MITEGAFDTDVYVADYTNYLNNGGTEETPAKGVIISTAKPPIINSLLITNKNSIKYEVVNFEHNKALLRNPDGTSHSQCECMCYALRDSGKSWILFVEMKYCNQKGIYGETTEAITQLKKTSKYILDEHDIFGGKEFARYFLVATPDAEPLDPFDAEYFNQDDMLTLKEEYKATLFLSNQVDIHTTIHLKLPKKP